MKMAGVPRASSKSHLLPLLFLSFTVLGSAEDTDFLSSVKLFDRPLVELTKGYVGSSLSNDLKFPPFASALTACQHHQKDIKELIDDANPSETIGVCDKLRYLSEVKHLTSASRNSGAEAILTKTDESSFSQLFMDYMEARKPVLVKNQESTWNEEDTSALKTCATDSTLTGVPLSSCETVLSNIKVPTLATNDYLVRLTPCALRGEPTQENCASSPYIQVPSAIQLTSTGTELKEACPMGMSCVFELVSGTAEVVIYDPMAEIKEAGSIPLLIPQTGSEPETLHLLTYSHNPFDQLKTVNVIDGGLLFIPHGMLVALKGNALLVKYCFTDAAALHTVRHKATIEAHVDKSTALLATALSSPHLDTTMVRQPSSSLLSWQSHSQWPRKDGAEGEEGGKTKRKRKSQSDWQAETKWKWRIVALTMPKLEPPIIKSIGRQNATIGWMSSFQVSEADATDFGYNISWHFGHEAAAAGGISVKHSDLVAAGHVKFAFDNYNAFDLSYTIPEGSLLPSTEYSFRVGVYYGLARSPASSSSASFTTPSMACPSRMHTSPVPVTEKESEFITPQGAVNTGVTLMAMPPLDDGGSPIIAYIVEAKHVQPHMSGDWEVLGSFLPEIRSGKLLFTIDHLIPNTSYQFRLSAYNQVGVSEPGTPTISVHTGSEQNPTSHVLGHGSKAFQPHHVHTLSTKEGDGVEENSALKKLKDHLTALLDPHVFQVHGPVITLEDANSMLSYKKPSDLDKGSHETFKMQVWSGHWSPKHFKVTAEIVMTDPPLAERPLNNARAVRGRIALVERGAVPLVEKVLMVQAAGGIGVIIDAGDCTAFDQFCSPGAEKKNGDGFGMLDTPGPWERIRIPVVMLLRDDVDTLLALFE